MDFKCHKLRKMGRCFQRCFQSIDEVRNSFPYGRLTMWYSVQVPSSAGLEDAINVAGMPCLSHSLREQRAERGHLCTHSATAATLSVQREGVWVCNKKRLKDVYTCLHFSVGLKFNVFSSSFRFCSSE